MSKLKIWPHLTIIALAFALIGGVIGGLWVKYRQTDTRFLPSVARVERVDGTVGVTRIPDNQDSDYQWSEVAPNTPISVGERVYVRENSRATVAFTGRNFARLEPGAALDLLDLSDRRTQLALREGAAIFNVGALDSGSLFEVATSFGAFNLVEPGLYQMGYDDDGSAWISVLSGLAQLVGIAGTGQIRPGEMLTLFGPAEADMVLSRFDADYAGRLVNDYYSYQYRDTYDGRYRDYNVYLDDPYYYDPYNQYDSYRYASSWIPGLWQLDDYGDWLDVSGYGHLWRPRVAVGWAPYREGYWIMNDLYGLTWVSSEPWGYAPYHYGRWAFLNNQWYWVPDRVTTRPVYSPALVAFLPFTQGNVVGWVPLAPGDPYVVTYYGANWQPYYEMPVLQQVVNLGVPGAVTVVPVSAFDRVITTTVVTTFDPQMLRDTRPVLDPLSVAITRQMALQTTNTRRRVDIPPGIAKRLDETRIYTSAKPFAPPFREDLSRTVSVDVVPEREKRQKAQFKDERQTVARKPGEARRIREEQQSQTQRAAPEASERRVDDGAASGKGEAKREEQQLRQQERREGRPATPPASEPRRQPQQRIAQPGARQAPPAKAQQERAAPRPEQPRERATQPGRPARGSATPPGQARQQTLPQQRSAGAPGQARQQQGPGQEQRGKPQQSSRQSERANPGSQAQGPGRRKGTP